MNNKFKPKSKENSGLANVAKAVKRPARRLSVGLGLGLVNTLSVGLGLGLANTVSVGLGLGLANTLSVDQCVRGGPLHAARGLGQ